jgi:hypothetical protein
LDLFGRFISSKIPQIRAHVKGADLFLGMFWSFGVAELPKKLHEEKGGRR